MKKISKLLPAPQMEEDFISCVSYAPLCSLANEAFLGGEQLIPLSSFPTPSADYQMDSSPASFGYCHAGW